MAVTVNAGSSATFGIDAAASLTITNSGRDAVGVITFTSAAPDSGVPSFTAPIQEKVWGPFLAPMQVTIAVTNGTCSYQPNGNTGGFSYDTSGNITGLVDGDGNTQSIAFPTPATAYRYDDSLLNTPTNTYNFIGFDSVDNVVWVRDDTNGLLRQGSTADDWANITFTSSRATPTSPNAIVVTQISRLIRFNGYIYMLAKDGTTNLVGLYRSLPIVGAGNFSWSAPLIQFAAMGTSIYTSINASATHLWLAEYGDVSGGPTAWKSTDGVAWTITYTEQGLSPSQRHIHAIAEDPYNPGHVWMTLGDANAPREIMRSVDYGVTWGIVTADSRWQGLQISFTRDFVYMANDSRRGIVFTIDRDTNVITWASTGLMRNVPMVRADAFGDEWYNSAFYGVVDANTGEYYCSAQDVSSGGNVAGIFCVPARGAPPVLVEKVSAATAIDIAGGYLWFGKYRRKL